MIDPVWSGAITYASALALLACSVTLVYMSTKTFNFANASMATWGLYIVYTGQAFYGGSPYLYFPLAFLFGGILGAVWYVTVNRRLLRRGASETVLMMSTLGYELILLAFAQMYADILTGPPFLMASHALDPRDFFASHWDFPITGLDALPVILLVSAAVAVTAALLFFRVKAKVMNRLSAITTILLMSGFGGVIAILLVVGVLGAITVVSLMMAMVILIALHLFLARTKFGIAVRATVENPQLASVGGINSDRVYLTSWIIGGGLASLGGAVVGFMLTGGPEVGWNVIVPMFAASILGGLYSIYGGTLGGYIVGLAEYVGMTALASALGGWILVYRPVVPLAIMVIALLVLPQGLAGLSWQSTRKRILRLGKIFTKVSVKSSQTK